MNIVFLTFNISFLSISIMIKYIYSSIILVSMLLLLLHCKDVSTNKLVINIEKAPFKKLSDYHFFINNLKNLEPTTGLITYDLMNSFDMNHALSKCFLYVPKDSIVNYNETSVLKFPIGSCLIKNCYYNLVENDTSKGKRIIETQLLIHQKNGWVTVSYIWNKEQTEATLNTKAAELLIETSDNKNQILHIYNVFASSQCATCHSNNTEITPIGPKVANLNFDKKYADGKIRNQLDKWASIGFLKGLKCPATSPCMPNWEDSTEDLQNRALAYLDVNCAHCHSAKSTVDLSYNPQDSAHASFFNACNTKSIYAANNSCFIKANQPDSSAIYSSLNYRFNHAYVIDNKAGYIDPKATQLIYEWIKNINLKTQTSASSVKCKL